MLQFARLSLVNSKVTPQDDWMSSDSPLFLLHRFHGTTRYNQGNSLVQPGVSMSLEDLPEISIHLIKNNANHKFHPQTEIATHMLLAFGNVFCLSFDLGKPTKKHRQSYQTPLLWRCGCHTFRSLIFRRVANRIVRGRIV